MFVCYLGYFEAPDEAAACEAAASEFLVPRGVAGSARRPAGRMKRRSTRFVSVRSWRKRTRNCSLRVGSAFPMSSKRASGQVRGGIAVRRCIDWLLFRDVTLS